MNADSNSQLERELKEAVEFLSTKGELERVQKRAAAFRAELERLRDIVSPEDAQIIDDLLAE